jgi:hypothetical protein
MKNFKFLKGYQLTIKCTVLIVCCVFIYLKVEGQNSLAIPGALGFAKHVRGAYAGSSTPAILIVDTLTGQSVSTSDTSGSFRWALEQDYPRIVIFSVSGYINLETYLRVYNPYLSVYGQTAPGKGITITGSYVDLRTDYVILQHLRFRLNSNSTAQEDALTIFRGSNVFVDHCSFSYALDENIGVGGLTGTFTGPLTISNCILSHPIYGKSSKGILMGGTVDSVSVIRNAFVHCGQRSPYIGDTTYTTVEIINNLCYNAEYYGIMLTKGNAPKINIIGNQWKPGNNSVNPQNRGAIRIRENMDTTSKFFIKDNLCPGRVDGAEWDVTVKIDIDNVDSVTFYQAGPFNYTPLDDIYPARELLNKLDSNAGAFYWDRDPVDSIAIYDMQHSTGNWIEADEKMYPPIPELSVTHILPEKLHVDEDGNGFTNLEEWIHNIPKSTEDSDDDGDENDDNEDNTLINDVENNEALIFPNPAISEVTILTGADSEITIYDIYGVQYYKRQVSGQTTIPLQYPAGLYFISIITRDNKTSTHKLLIKK